MPGRFLTDSERDRLNRFPDPISPEDLATFFTLSPQDLARILRCRGDHNRLGYALQLSALRYLGFCPARLSTAPPEAVVYLAQQLHVSPAVLADYGERSHTRTDHWQAICTYLSFQEPGPEQLRTLQRWLVERALEHDKPTLLLQMAAQKLHADKVVRPAITRLERMVAAARQKAHRETYRRLAPWLTPERQQMLDQLLVPTGEQTHAALIRFRRNATSATPPSILGALDRRADLLELEAHQFDLSCLNPNRRHFLAQLGRRSTPQALQRLNPERRYPVLLTFLVQMLEDTTDEIVDLFDRCLMQAHSRARVELEEFRRATARASNEKLWMFQNIAQVVLDPDIADDQIRSVIYQRISADQLQAAVQECELLVRPLDDNYFDLVEKRYGYLRQFTPMMLAALQFRGYQAQESLLKALQLLQRLNQEGRYKIPDHWETPLDFVPAKWLPYVTHVHNDTDGRHYYELCALWQLQAGLRAGNVWLENSRRYADPDSYLLPVEQWPQQRSEACRQMQVDQDGKEQLRVRQTQLQDRLAQLAETLPQTDAVRLVDGELTVSRLPADPRSQSAKELAELIAQRLPLVQLPELLMEVDRWTHFTRHFEHAGGQTSHPPDLETLLYASILAQGCNFGLERIAQMTGLSDRQLAWCTGWYLREDTLRSAVAALVDFQYHLPLSQHWGSGTLSSSDGQRFPVSVKSLNATALPRYFGYGRGVTFYTWTSDQFSQYGTKVIPATVRDATYVLDEILDNETELPIQEHTTDTAGYTEMLFALFDLLGLQFAPRIRDLADQRLYSMPGTVVPPGLAPLLAGQVNVRRILSHWDDLLRVAASLKSGWVTASLLIGKLQSYPRQNAVARALQEYGRLSKTIFVLHILENEEYRRALSRQLNKGEELHDLRLFLFLARQAIIRRAQPEDQANQAGCLNLLTNAVIVWNTVYMQAVLHQLEQEGMAIEEADLARIWPVRYRHINPYGRYDFSLPEEYSLDRLRPLRGPSAEPVRT